jgi:hypothetical protein
MGVAEKSRVPLPTSKSLPINSDMVQSCPGNGPGIFGRSCECLLFPSKLYIVQGDPAIFAFDVPQHKLKVVQNMGLSLPNSLVTSAWKHSRRSLYCSFLIVSSSSNASVCVLRNILTSSGAATDAAADCVSATLSGIDFSPETAPESRSDKDDPVDPILDTLLDAESATGAALEIVSGTASAAVALENNAAVAEAAFASKFERGASASLSVTRVRCSSSGGDVDLDFRTSSSCDGCAGTSTAAGGSFAAGGRADTGCLACRSSIFRINSSRVLSDSASEGWLKLGHGSIKWPNLSQLHALSSAFQSVAISTVTSVLDNQLPMLSKGH